MSENDIKKAVEICTKVKECHDCPLSGLDYVCGVYLSKYIAEKENEPAPAATETSSEVSSNDTSNLTHFDDNTSRRICQELDVINNRLQTAFDNDLESDIGIRLFGEASGMIEMMCRMLKGGDLK